jgi:F-type H+-transporting ATPase subunit a
VLFGMHLLPLLGTNITVGEHVQTKVGPLTFNLDTIWATAFAALITVLLGLAVARRPASGVPSKLQLVWEMGVDAVTRQLEGSVGARGLSVVPLAITLFVFIIICNALEVFGLGAKYEWLGAPTGDINLTLALALIVIIPVHVVWVRTLGFRGYARHYLLRPFPKWLLPFNAFINVIEEIARPLTLALRLFGNLLAGGLMLTLIAALGAWTIAKFPIGDVTVFFFAPIWKLFDVFFIGPIQAFIFALLTILYFDTAMTPEAAH